MYSVTLADAQNYTSPSIMLQVHSIVSKATDVNALNFKAHLETLHFIPLG